MKLRSSSSTPPSPSQPVSENPFWLNVEANARRYGLFLLLAIVIAALCGLFSKGWLSHMQRTTADGVLSLEYERFGRLMSDTEMKIVVHADTGKEVTVVLGGDFMETFQITTLQPQPDRMQSQNNRLVLSWSRDALPADHAIWLGVQPLQWGKSQSTVAVDKGPSLPFWQFIYP